MNADAPADALRLSPVDFDPFAADRLGTELPLTDAQQEVWAACQMGPLASASYNQSFAYRLRGSFSLASMRAAIEQLPGRHQALRVAFASSGDCQRVVPTAAIPVTVADWTADPIETRAAKLDELMSREAIEPFDLSVAPLARAHIIQASADEHLLVFTAHHLVCDGQSSILILADLADLYNADRYGVSAPAPDFAPYDEHVRRAISACGSDDEYWLRRFASPAAALELPTDRPRPPDKTFRGALARVRFDESCCRSIKGLAARHGCTFFVVLFAAWQTLLHRLTSQTDIVVGIPVGGPASDDRLVGHFVHMLPVRSRVDPSAPFSTHLTAVRGAVVDAHEHRGTTYGRLVRELALARDISRTPLLSVVFNVDRPSELPRFDRLAVERLPAPRFTATFDLAVDIADSGTELELECRYNGDLFDAGTVQRWLEYYRVLLESAAADAAVPLERINMLPDGEREALVQASRARRSFDQGPLHRRFESVVARKPEAVALRHDGQSTTYGALNARANRIAHRLRALGVRLEEPVAICLDASPDLVAAIIGVLKAGGAYVPVDPESPLDRTRLTLSEARCRVVITTANRASRFEDEARSIVALDRDAAAIDGCPATNLEGDVLPAHLAYVIFTSGSTGRPKGVAVTHGNVSRLFAATEPWFHFGPEDTWTLFHSAAFDFSVWELWGALLHGGRLVLVPYWISRSPDAFHALLEHERVTVLNQTPSAFRQLIEADRTAVVDALNLRLIVFGGEALELATLRGWIARHGDERPVLVNMFGITETTVHVTYRRVTVEDVERGHGSPIGVAIPDLDLYLLAPTSGELVPIGVPGEICVGGPGVARGYVNGQALTGERFTPDGFGGRSGHRLYRSGDLGRRLANGDIEYLGRLDSQVKIRGFRVEVGEIVAALSAHPAVREATVVLAAGPDAAARLIAYVVAAPPPTPASDPGLRPPPPTPASDPGLRPPSPTPTSDPGTTVPRSDLLAHLRERLPEYMIPTSFVFVDALPLNENGKLDRARLPRPDVTPDAAGDFAAPRTPTEHALAEIWRELLDLPQVGIDESFFDIGGHSMLAAKIVSRIKERFGANVTIASLFHAPTIAALAEIVDALGVTAATPAAGALDREVIEL